MSESSGELPPPRFRKTKTDKWAVMAPLETLETALSSTGGVVEVHKKNGGTSSFTVASLGRPFDVDGVQMCYGYAPDDESDPSTARPASNQARGASDQHGARGSAPDQHSAQPSQPATPEPPREEEPMPVFQGDESDVWVEEF